MTAAIPRFWPFAARSERHAAAAQMAAVLAQRHSCCATVTPACGVRRD
jgi:hypothetical protein